MIAKMRILALLACATAVYAAPRNSADKVCSEIKHSLGPKAPNVCLSYLGSRSTTTTVTATVVQTKLQTKVLPAPTKLATVQVTTTVYITSEATLYSQDPTETQTQTVTGPTSTVYKYSGASKRSERNSVLCGLERKYSPSLVAAGCSRICKPSTKTFTRTVTVTQSTTLKVTNGPASTVVVTDTQYVPVTQIAVVTETLAPTSTETVQATTTVIPILVKPAICNARGLPGPNAFNYDANFNSNQADCIRSCKSDNRCYSTGFYIVTDPGSGSQTGTCRKYDKSVTDSDDLGPGYYNFNDKDCPV